MEWQPIENAPKDGVCIDVWCAPPEDSEFSTPGVRLTVVAWRVSDSVMDFTGWVRVLDDGNWDKIERPAEHMGGLPTWIPTHWMPLPAPPTQETSK